MIGPNEYFNPTETEFEFEVEVLDDDSEPLSAADKEFIDYSNVANKMLRLEELFRLSMEPKNLLESYLYKNEDDLTKMNKFSANMREYLVSHVKRKRKKSDGQLERFLRAFSELVPTQGYSMIKYLKSNESLGDFLSSKIDKLFPIYEGFLKYKSLCADKENLTVKVPDAKRRKALELVPEKKSSSSPQGFC